MIGAPRSSFPPPFPGRARNTGANTIEQVYCWARRVLCPVLAHSTIVGSWRGWVWRTNAESCEQLGDRAGKDAHAEQLGPHQPARSSAVTRGGCPGAMGHELVASNFVHWHLRDVHPGTGVLQGVGAEGETPRVVSSPCCAHQTPRNIFIDGLVTEAPQPLSHLSLGMP